MAAAFGGVYRRRRLYQLEISVGLGVFPVSGAVRAVFDGVRLYVFRLLRAAEKNHRAGVAGWRYFGLALGDDVSADDCRIAIYHAVGQCVFGQYPRGDCAVSFLGRIRTKAEPQLLSCGGHDTFRRLSAFAQGGFSHGFRRGAFPSGSGGVFPANDLSGEFDPGLRCGAYCDRGEPFDSGGDDGDFSRYGVEDAASISVP